jgi:hypothetical protein
MSDVEMPSEPLSPKSSVSGEERAARVRKYDMLEAEASPRAKSPEAKQWFDFVSESRLRIDNLRTMYSLNMMSPDERFTKKSGKVDRSGIVLLIGRSLFRGCFVGCGTSV